MTQEKAQQRIIVAFNEAPSRRLVRRLKVDAVVCKNEHFDGSPQDVKWVDVESFRDIANAQDAYRLVEQVYTARFADGSRMSQEITHRGHELVWYFQQGTYIRHVLPYLEWRKLLSFLEDYSHVYLYGAPGKLEPVFRMYCEAFGIEFETVVSPRGRVKKTLVFNLYIVMNIIHLAYSLASLPVLMVKRPPLLLWQGSDFIHKEDFDFRYENLYMELRKRKLPFIEFVRTRQRPATMLKNMWIRRRAVIYHDAFKLPSLFIPALQWRFLHRRIASRLPGLEDRESGLNRFYLLVGMAQYINCLHLKRSAELLKIVIRLIGVKAFFSPAAPYRNSDVMLACKLLAVPIVGSQTNNLVRHEVIGDFLPAFSPGDRAPCVDHYGMWSAYFRDYVTRHSNVYNADNTFVAGHSRPFWSPGDYDDSPGTERGDRARINVMLMSEPLTDNSEVEPYIQIIAREPDLHLWVKCRPDRNDPILSVTSKYGVVHQATGSLKEAFATADVVVGSRSTAVIEGMIALKPIVLLATRKWGDYYECQGGKFGDFVDRPQDVVSTIRRAAATPAQELKRRRDYMWGDINLNGAVSVVDKIEELIEKR